MANFAAEMKAHLRDWVAEGGIDHEKLEARNGKPSLVLKEAHKRSNLYSETWWRYIEAKEHRWARALNSSQCFAVNLFAPLAEEPDLARLVLEKFVPDLSLSDDRIVVHFEHTPDGAPSWLGERGQPTQVDVAFEALRNGHPRAVLLTEVKFTEPDFGSCRGFPAHSGKSSANPDPSRCLSAARIREHPERYCWLVESEGRRYWDLLRQPGSSFDVDELGEKEPCPFRGGLYQVMRNSVLADEMARRRGLDWAGFALCIHGGNKGVWSLTEPVAGATDARDSLSALMTRDLLLIDPCSLVDAVAKTAPSQRDWGDYMKSRYRL